MAFSPPITPPIFSLPSGATLSLSLISKWALRHNNKTEDKKKNKYIRI